MTAPPDTITVRLPRRLLLAAAGVIALVAVAVPSAIGARALLAPPTAVAVVNVPKVLEQLDQRADAEAKLQTMADELSAEDQTWVDRMGELEKRAETLDESDDAARYALIDEVTALRIQYKGFQVFASERLDIEKSILLQNLERLIRDAIADFASANGYDVVFLDDSSKSVAPTNDAKVPREIQVMQKVQSRRIIYANPAVDITDAIIERMNNTFNNERP